MNRDEINRELTVIVFFVFVVILALFLQSGGCSGL